MYKNNNIIKQYWERILMEVKNCESKLIAIKPALN